MVLFYPIARLTSVTSTDLTPLMFFISISNLSVDPFSSSISKVIFNALSPNATGFIEVRKSEDFEKL